MASSTLIEANTASVLAKRILDTPLEFVPAKLPESMAIQLSNYTIIKRPINERVESEATSDASANEDSDSTTQTSISSPDTEVNEAEDESDDNKPIDIEFYEINEHDGDRGSRKNARILKSWLVSKVIPKGLMNRAVTCYMNAAIQAIIHIPAMVHYLEDVFEGKYEKLLPRNSVTMELARLYKHLIANNAKLVYPRNLIKRLDDINALMSEFEQEDSHEYFMSLIGRLQEDSVPKGQKLNTSIIHEVFGGSINQRVVCSACGHISTTHQDFYDLPVSFSTFKRKHKGYSLERSIREFFEQEKIKPDSTKGSGYNCEKCRKLTIGVKTSRIEEPPEYLNVHIKRFKYNGSSPQKVKEPMSYPMDLDLTKHSVSGEPIRYRLLSVIVHEGRTVSRGHYTAICRQANNTWAEYDDEIVSSVSVNKALKQGSAYMLVYCRLTKKPTRTRRTKSVGVKRPDGILSSKRSVSLPAEYSDQSLISKKRSLDVDIESEIDKIFEKKPKNDS